MTKKGVKLPNVAVLGTGPVGESIGSKLVSLGYQVKMGSRTKDNKKAIEWTKKTGKNAFYGTFEEAARFGEIIFLCTKGEGTLDAIRMAQLDNFTGKTVIDITNPLAFSEMPPYLYISNRDSLGEHIQKLIPDANVVKTLNLVNAGIMIDPKRIGSDPTMFLAGNNDKAKREVQRMLEEFGWVDIMDLGDMTNARGMEMFLPLWARIYSATGNADFALKIMRKKR